MALFNELAFSMEKYRAPELGADSETEREILM